MGLSTLFAHARHSLHDFNRSARTNERAFSNDLYFRPLAAKVRMPSQSARSIHPRPSVGVPSDSRECPEDGPPTSNTLATRGETSIEENARICERFQTVAIPHLASHPTQTNRNPDRRDLGISGHSLDNLQSAGGACVRSHAHPEMACTSSILAMIRPSQSPKPPQSCHVKPLRSVSTPLAIVHAVLA